MTRFRLLVEYDGGPYVGWQRQENGASIQQALEKAVFAFCGERVATTGAGRTDAGVHALGQVVHLDIVRQCRAETLRDAVNFHLKPQPIAVLAAAEAGPDFHARFSAIDRRYLYRVLNRRAPPVLERGRPGGSRFLSMRRPCRKRPSVWWDATTSRASAPPSARRPRR